MSPVILAALGQGVRGTLMGDVVLARDIPWMVDLHAQGRLKLDELISRRWPFEQINAAIADTNRGQARRKCPHLYRSSRLTGRAPLSSSLKYGGGRAGEARPGGGRAPPATQQLPSGATTMKLQSLETFAIAPPPPRMGRALLADRADHHLLRDHGGWARSMPRGVGHAAMQAVIADVFARHMEGENPENIELMSATRLVLGLHPAARSHGLRRLRGARDGLLGHPRQDARPAGLGASGRAMNDRLRAYTYLYPEDGAPEADVRRFWIEALWPRPRPPPPVWPRAGRR